ncbi:GGDEF domain-containing protein [Marinobacter arenosus]|uniref:GGDEF domain-containing protein n=1 Tax=Marinobacter arenosus TaxID=2856822 RepID=UPI001C4BF397|nr:GGDEF domain-containing protein [Marinobacter arenosus]MBW0148469.1 GGDEF domain-containing protein [Marinobacter arenosus]
MELNVHLPTLVMLSIAVNLLIGALLWAVYRLRDNQPCFLVWTGACASFVLGSLLASAGAFIEAPLLTVLVGHLSLGVSPLLLLAGIHRLMELPFFGSRHSARILKFASGIYVFGLVVSFEGDPVAARFLTALYSALLFSLAVYRLSRIKRKPRLPFRVLQSLFAIHGILMMIQVLTIACGRSGLVTVDIDAMLSLILFNHLLLATATVLALPLLAFTQAEQDLRELAERDELTRLLNRRAFYREGLAAFEQARQRGQLLTVLMIDLDYFKQINDRWGHAVGDDALRFVATLLAEELRDVDTVGRIGGEEFAAVLNTGNRAEVEAITGRLLARLAERGRVVAGRPLYLSASIGGVAMTPETGSFAEMMQLADAAMYRAKTKGRNRVEFAPRVDPAV